jgi:tRNA(Met) C34 N-acetyltransferase TmcA
MKTEQHENISIDRNFNTDTWLTAGDQILQTKYEDDLQQSVYTLNTTAVEFSIETINGGGLKLWLLEKLTQLEARYALMTQYWNKLIHLIIWDINISR